MRRLLSKKLGALDTDEHTQTYVLRYDYHAANTTCTNDNGHCSNIFCATNSYKFESITGGLTNSGLASKLQTITDGNGNALSLMYCCR